ncbi:MAG: hypothetical protein JO336_13995 [Acidobacteriia bacterium]|nr:hypothetical protein [Terriglobia bacterium]MBV8903806.1 hypothetical protein [Terriglobia bacterium]
MLGESFRPYFEWCGNTWLGTTVRDTVWAFPLIETFHLLALAVLLGTVLIVNLRVFGLGKQYLSASQLARQLEPWMLVSIGVLIATGIPMAFSEPMKCFESYSFPIKMSLIVVGVISQFTIQRRWIMANTATTGKAKLAAILSIFIWTAVGAAGKGIPYV